MIVQIGSIEQISNQKISEILNLLFGINIPRQRVHDLFNKKIDKYTSMSIQELQEEILNLVVLYIMMKSICGSNTNHMSD